MLLEAVHATIIPKPQEQGQRNAPATLLSVGDNKLTSRRAASSNSPKSRERLAADTVVVHLVVARRSSDKASVESSDLALRLP